MRRRMETPMLTRYISASIACCLRTYLSFGSDILTSLDGTGRRRLQCHVHGPLQHILAQQPEAAELRHAPLRETNTHANAKRNANRLKRKSSGREQTGSIHVKTSGRSI